MNPKYEYDEPENWYDPDEGLAYGDNFIDDEIDDQDTYDWDERDSEGYYDPYDY